MKNVPKGWRIISIEDGAEVCGGIQKGPHRTAGRNPVRYLTVAHVQRDCILTDDPRYFEVTPTELDRWRLAFGDLLIVEGNGSADEIGRTALFRGEIKNCVHQNHVIRVRPNSSIFLSEYLNAFLNSSAGRLAVQAQSSTSSGLRTLSVGRIKQIPVPCPSIVEQEKICLLNGFLKRLTDTTELLLKVNLERKRGLMQQLLTGQTRFKDFKGERWRTYRLGDLLQEVDRYVRFDDEHTYKLASIRRRSEGLFFREALQGKDIKTKVMKTIRAGDFILSKMQVVHGAWGLVTPEFDRMFVSDSYISLVPKHGSALKIEFLNYLSQMRFMRHLAYICSHGVHIEKMTFNLDDFLHEKITIPPTIEEQTKIVGVLSACDDEIKLLEKQLEALREQKRGLMQKLLTGDVRVKLQANAKEGR
jgi:type I restriction enzyme, S subunit